MPVTPASRARDMPDEYKVKNGLLFCKWCDKSIQSLRMDNLHGHIHSESHQAARIQQGAKMSFDPLSQTRLKFLAMRKRKKERAKIRKVEVDAEEGLRKLFSNSDSEDSESFQGFDENEGPDFPKNAVRRNSDNHKKKNLKKRRFSEPSHKYNSDDSDDWTSPTQGREKVSYSARRSRTSSKQGSLKIKISRKSKSQDKVHGRSSSRDSARSTFKERSRSFHENESSEESDASEKNVQIEPCGDTLKLKFVLNKTKYQDKQHESDFVDEITSENGGSEMEQQGDGNGGSGNEELEIENEDVAGEEVVQMGEEEFDTWEAIGPFTDEEKVEEEMDGEEIVSSIPPPPVLKEPMTQEETLAIKANHARQMAKSVNSAQFAKKSQKKSLSKNHPQQSSSDKMKNRRISGYNMWASNIRRQIGSQFPGMQFGDVSKRVGDLWKRLADKEKKMWKHKSMKMYQEQLRKMENSSATKRKFGSKMIETGPKKKSTFSSPPSKKVKIDPTEPKRKPTYVQQSKRQSILKSPTRTPSTQQKDNSLSMSPPHKNPAQMMERDLQKLPPPQLGLMDAAAHFALLGETLTTIGNKVANLGNKYSGNVVIPLMLDSFMCSITPLLSLTNQVPGLQDSIPAKTVSDTLANVHNFMPGI